MLICCETICPIRAVKEKGSVMKIELMSAYEFNKLLYIELYVNRFIFQQWAFSSFPSLMYFRFALFFMCCKVLQHINSCGV